MYDTIEDIAMMMIEYQTFAENDTDEIKEAIVLFVKYSKDFYALTEGLKEKDLYLEQVKAYVLKLNQLNMDSQYALIETDEREMIYQFIEDRSIALGFDFDYDITLEDRDW